MGCRPHVPRMDIRPIKEIGKRWNHVVMGPVINFPGSAAEAPKHGLADDRRHAVVTALSALTFLLGFFIVGPSLALFAFGFASPAHIGSPVSCLAGLLITWAVT